MGKIAGGRTRRGKPTMEKVAETGKLQPRQKQYCDLRLKGYSKKEAGERVNPHPANEQQIKAWEDNPATVDYIRTQGGLPRTIEEGNKLLLEDTHREIILKVTRDIREDKEVNPMLFEFVKGMSERLRLEGTGDPVRGKGKQVSFSALVDNLPPETKALMQDKKGEGKKIKRRKIEVEEQ